MTDEIAPSSDGGNESVQPIVETTPESSRVETEPAKSPREALERAMAKMQEPVDAQEKPTRERDPETGKFTQKTSDAPVASFPEAEKPEAKQAEVKPVEALKPPPRFAKIAQEAWVQTPEPVRTEVERAITELTQGIEKYKSSAEAYEPVRQFDEMARKSGTTLDRALHAFVGIENAWRQNPATGFVAVCQNMGVDPVAQLHDIAAALNGQAVPRGDMPEVAALKQELAQVKSELGNFGKTLTETKEMQRQREAAATIEKFADGHPHFDELADTIGQLLETKFAKDLSDAYEKALRLTPEIAAKIEADKKPALVDAAQTRDKASKSITGSPTLGSNPSAKKPAGSARDALQNAFAQVGLG